MSTGQTSKTCTQCGHPVSFDRGCGAMVCGHCGNHNGLCRCYCGWSLSGNDGYRELIDEGENIEPDY